jgi:phospholipid transport system substrate-binding protein
LEIHEEARKVKRTMALVLAALFSVFAVSFGFVGSAHAGPALDIVKTKQTALFELIKKPSTPDNQKKIEAMFDEMLDYKALAEGSLGGEYGNLSDADKAEFTNLLKQLVRKAYEKNLKKTVAFDIQYLGETPADPATMVNTKAVHKTDSREEPIEINFKMQQRDGAWKVQDIVTEGQSLVASYRGQFIKIVKKDGFKALAEKMKKKLAKGDVGAG